MSQPLGDIISDFATGTYSVARHTADTFVNGRKVEATASALTILATVVPLNGQDLLRLEEGERTSESLAVFTATQLRPGGAGYEPDVITIGASTYQVAMVEDWAPWGFYRAIVVKRGHG